MSYKGGVVEHPVLTGKLRLVDLESYVGLDWGKHLQLNPVAQGPSNYQQERDTNGDPDCIVNHRGPLFS